MPYFFMEKFILLRFSFFLKWQSDIETPGLPVSSTQNKDSIYESKEMTQLKNNSFWTFSFVDHSMLHWLITRV